jgi:hypothetical protein
MSNKKVEDHDELDEKDTCKLGLGFGNTEEKQPLCSAKGCCM